MAMQLDDLDERILNHFGPRFTKPSELDYCEIDASPEDVEQLCHHPRPYEVNNLIGLFMLNNRLGLFGNWRDFPPFAADVMVFCRRDSLSLEHDLAFFFLHLSRYGVFSVQEHPLIREWIADILLPWQRPILRGDLYWWEEHAIGYLVMLFTLGGNIEEIFAKHVERAKASKKTTGLLSRLKKCLQDDGRLNETLINEHFENMPASCDNQELPGQDFVDKTSVNAVIEAIARRAPDITRYGR